MNDLTLPRLHIVVLAAGFSSRLGRPKALVTVGGMSLLRRTLLIVAPLARSGITVVVPPRAPRFGLESQPFGAALVVNSERRSGLSSSVRRAVLAARSSAAVLILPVDLAALSRRDLARLLSRWRGARRRVVARRLAHSPGAAARQAGTPLILPKWLYRRALGISGDVGLRDLINALSTDRVALVDLPSAHLDVDTPADLETARRRRQAPRRP